MVDGSLAVDDPSPETTAPGPPGPSRMDRLDPVQAAYTTALRRFRRARAAFIAASLVYLFVLTSGLPRPHAAAPTTTAAPSASAPSSTVGETIATTVPAAALAAAGVPLTWEDLTTVPLGTTEDVLRREASVCTIVSDQQVGDHTERAYSCKGAHAGSAARFVVVAGAVTQRSSSNLRGERDSPTMTAEKFAALSKGMSEADALAVTGACDLGVDQLVNGGRVASWTCYGPGSGFVVIVIENGVVKELLNSLT